MKIGVKKVNMEAGDNMAHEQIDMEIEFLKRHNELFQHQIKMYEGLTLHSEAIASIFNILDDINEMFSGINEILSGILSIEEDRAEAFSFPEKDREVSAAETVCNHANLDSTPPIMVYYKKRKRRPL